MNTLHRTSGVDCDVLIVGSGIMGATVARQVREQNPDASIIMIDGGPLVGSIPGQHLHDTPEAEIREQFAARAARGNQASYVKLAAVDDTGVPLAQTEAGMHTLAAFGADSGEMPGSSIAWNVGGMGAHWAAATPWPYADEVVEAIPSAEWAADLATAQRLLRVDPSPYGSTAAGDAVIGVLDGVFGPASDDGRHVQPMPLAMTTNADGTLSRVGPNAIFPAMAHGGDAAFELRASALATSVDRDDALDAARVTGATVRDTLTGATSTITARVTVVCADTMRTPQLLWASGIRPEALGRYLNEHAFLVGTVIVDTAALGIEEIPVPRPGEWSTSSTWLPYSGAHQPFHGQIMQSPVVDDDGTRGYAVLLALYIPTELRAENRLEFSDTELDHAGMPRTTVRFDYSPVDLELIARAKAVQAEAASLLGDFDSERDATLLPAGSSLHFTGTVRMGAVDDGTSVCDTDGRVWGFDNLFVAGNGVVPTALACNSTLTGAITAVRAARAVGAVLEPAV